MADRPPPEPAKLLASWMEWERGDQTPGRVMANLKTAGLRELLEALAEAETQQAQKAQQAAPPSAPASGDAAPA